MEKKSGRMWTKGKIFPFGNQEIGKIIFYQ